MLTKKDKENILKAFREIDVKKLELDHPDEKAIKWFRFGSFIGIDVASEVIKNFPEKDEKDTKKKLINVTG